MRHRACDSSAVDTPGGLSCRVVAALIDTENPSALAALGDSFFRVGRVRDALPCLQKAAVLAPDRSDVWYRLGRCYEELREYVIGTRCYERASDRSGANGRVLYRLGRCQFYSGNADAAIRTLERAVAARSNRARTALAVAVPAAPAAGQIQIRSARADWAQAFPSLPPLAGPRSARPSHRPIRVAYLTSFAQFDNWMKPVWGLINHHDRRRIAVELFADASPDAFSSAYTRRPEDVVHDISRLSNHRVASLIAERDVDVLVDLNGYSRPDRLPVLLRRPAPMQVGWFALNATSALPELDYVIADPIVLPHGEESYYSERVLRVTTCWLPFEVHYVVPDIVPPPCSRGNVFTFGCLAPLYKITPEVMATWAEILRAAPETRLLLRNRELGAKGNCAYIVDVFAEHGVDEARLVLMGPADHREFLETYDRIDLVLDTFPYNGGTTTAEALWQGCPVITFPGDRWVARIGASLLKNGGLHDLVASDRAGYVERAVELACSTAAGARLLPRRMGMRDHLRRTPVCDLEGFARELEAIYARICR